MRVICPLGLSKPMPETRVVFRLPEALRPPKVLEAVGGGARGLLNNVNDD